MKQFGLRQHGRSRIMCALLSLLPLVVAAHAHVAGSHSSHWKWMFSGLFVAVSRCTSEHTLIFRLQFTLFGYWNDLHTFVVYIFCFQTVQLTVLARWFLKYGSIIWYLMLWKLKNLENAEFRSCYTRLMFLKMAETMKVWLVFDTKSIVPKTLKCWDPQQYYLVTIFILLI